MKQVFTTLFLFHLYAVRSLSNFLAVRQGLGIMSTLDADPMVLKIMFIQLKSFRAY